jgi:hypothetical protein
MLKGGGPYISLAGVKANRLSISSFFMELFFLLQITRINEEIYSKEG